MRPPALLRTPTLWLIAAALAVVGAGEMLVWQRAATWSDAAVVAAEQQRLTGLAVAAAGRIDPTQLAQAAQAHPDPGSVDSWEQAPVAARLQRAWLTDLQDGVGPEHHFAAWLVAESPAGSRPSLVRVVETAPMPNWLSPVEVGPEGLEALVTGQAAVTGPMAGRRGESVQAIAPLRGDRGAIVGLVMVEAPLAAARAGRGTWLEGHEQRIAAVLFTLTLLLALAGARVARGRRQLSAAAHRLAQADLAAPIALDADPEVGDLLASMEVARIRALERHQEHAAQRARWARTTEALHRSMDLSAFRRKEHLAELAPLITAGVRVAGGPIFPVRLSDLTADHFMVELSGGVALMPGAPARLLLTVPEDGEACDIAVVVEESRARADRVEVRLGLRQPRRSLALPRRIGSARHQREARRIYPGEARPLLARVRGRRHGMVGRVRDLSESGIAMLVRSDQLPQSGSWTTELTVHLQLPGDDAPRAIDARLVRSRGFDRFTLLALAFEERGRCSLGAHQQAIRGWVTNELLEQRIAVADASAG